MKSTTRAGWRLLSGVALFGLTIGAARAQCPATAATCTPGAASSTFAGAVNGGILNVSLGSLNNTTLGYTQGYRDYGCGRPTGTPTVPAATLNVGQTYTLTVRTPSVTGSSAETTLAWIDYSNDGAFDASELIMSSSNVMGTHTATFTPPGLATQNVPLRLRVSSDEAFSPTPTPCSTPVFSQVEDYSVVLTANTSPPTAVFTTNGTTTCTGTVQFTDQSQNLPRSWDWDFGDGTAHSNLQNPSHTYTMPGTYSVTLTTTNAAGTATSAATVITYLGTAPVAASCSPGTTNYFGGYGVVRFRLNTIDNASADGSAGYQDFSCPQRTTVVSGNAYPMTITTGGTNAHALRVYLDGDNNGIFIPAEKVYENLSAPVGGLTAQLLVPGNVTTGVPLRLRVVADFVGATLDPCLPRTNGQDEDYAVTVAPITTAPTVDFTSDYVAGNCVNPVTFADASTGIDGTSTWDWNFGDGSAHSAQQNPTHQYATTGTYTVALRVTNAIGSTTATKTNYVTVQVPCLMYCSSNGVGPPNMNGGFQDTPFWITSVGVTAATADANGRTYRPFRNATSTTTPAPNGYGNYTGLTDTLRQAQQHVMTIVSNITPTHHVTVWIDGNHDGIFDNAAERVVNYTGTGTTSYVQPMTIPSGFQLGTTRMRVQAVVNGNSATNSCAQNLQNAEIEDYSVFILPFILGTRAADALPGLSIYPNPTADGRLTLALDGAAGSGACAATVQDLLGAALLQTALRLDGRPAALDLSALPKGVYVLRLCDAQGRTALRRVVRD